MSYREVTEHIYVVETIDGDAFLGRISVDQAMVTVYTGYTGRPQVIYGEEIESMVLADEHPDVEVVS